MLKNSSFGHSIAICTAMGMLAASEAAAVDGVSKSIRRVLSPEVSRPRTLRASR